MILFVLWLISVPFVLALVPNPQLWLMAPWLIVFGLLMLLPVLVWIARKLHI